LKVVNLSTKRSVKAQKKFRVSPQRGEVFLPKIFPGRFIPRDTHLKSVPFRKFLLKGPNAQGIFFKNREKKFPSVKRIPKRALDNKDPKFFNLECFKRIVHLLIGRTKLWP